MYTSDGRKLADLAAVQEYLIERHNEHQHAIGEYMNVITIPQSNKKKSPVRQLPSLNFSLPHIGHSRAVSLGNSG